MKNTMNTKTSRNFRKSMKRFVAGLLVVIAMVGAGSALADSNLQLFDENVDLLSKKDGTPSVTFNVVDDIDIDRNGVYILKDDKGNTIYGDGYNRTVGKRYSYMDIKGEKEGDYGAGKYKIDLGNAEAKAGTTTGYYTTVDANGKVSNCYGAKADLSASASVLDIKSEGYLGNEDYNVKGKLNASLGNVGANVGAEVGLCNGQPMLRAEAGIEANAAKLEGSVGGTIGGVEALVGGSVKVGVGATAKAELKEGKFKFEVGAALGVGASIKGEVDIDAVTDKVEDGADAVYRLVNGYEQNPLAGEAWKKSVDENGNLVKTRSMQKGNVTESEYKSEGVHLHTTSASF